MLLSDHSDPHITVAYFSQTTLSRILNGCQIKSNTQGFFVGKNS